AVVWINNAQDGSYAGIFAQRFDSDGSTADTEFQVNSYTTNGQYHPAVAGLYNGDFVVTWDSDYQSGYPDGTFGQRFTSNGSAAGTEFQVNSYTGDTTYAKLTRGYPAVAAQG